MGAAGCGRVGYDPGYNSLVRGDAGGEASAAVDGDPLADAPVPPLDAPGGDQPRDTLVPDAGRDLIPPDGPAPDGPRPVDVAVPDVAVVDMAMRDVAVPDVAVVDTAVPDVAVPDVAVDAGRTPPCTSQRFWEVNFDSDPTKLDTNGDGQADWQMRFGAVFQPNQLQGGVWRSPSRSLLDTRPLDDFATRTVAFVRFRATTVPVVGGNLQGAVFWVNLDSGSPMFAAVVATLRLETNGTQTLLIDGRVANNTMPLLLLTTTGLSKDFVDLKLDIDPKGLSVEITVNGENKGRMPFPRTGPPVGDRFATLATFDCEGEFDDAAIYICQP